MLVASDAFDPPLLQKARDCTVCAPELPLGPRPIFRIHPAARIVLISQAPGRLAHLSGVPWDDPGGRRLRQWLDVEDDFFFNSPFFAILPVGLCYPGKGKGGDRPPLPACAPLWHEPLLHLMPAIRLRILIGAHAQKLVLGDQRAPTLTANLRQYTRHLKAGNFPLPHPSPRNRLFLRRNPWIETEIIPHLQSLVREIRAKG